MHLQYGDSRGASFEDGTVDLLTAASAAHWFDKSRFLPEASRVLKPRGCMALLGFTDTNIRLNYKDCGDQLNRIYQEVKELLQPYTSNPVAASESKLQDLYTAIPFPDKERIESYQSKSMISVSRLVGFISTWSMYNSYKRKDPQGAEDLLANVQKRFLDEMGATSPDTEIEREWEYFCVLASKPL